MKFKMKKWVVYLLATMMVMPTWLIMGMAGAKPAMAAVIPKEFTRHSANVSAFPTSSWNVRGEELFTWHSIDNSYVKANNVIDAPADAAGIYKIEAQWLVWTDHTKDASYEISQGTDVKNVLHVDQTKMADGSTAANDTVSGYYVLDSNYHFNGSHDVDIKLLGENSDNGNNSFISFRVTFISENSAPDAPVLTTPANNSFIADRNPQFVWQPSVDKDGDSLKYEIFVYKVGDNSAKIHLDDLTATSYQSTNPHKLSDGQYFWYVLASDGTASSKLSDVSYFTVDTAAPSVPANLTAGVEGANVNLAWDSSTDGDGSGIAGYNIYREGTVGPINSVLVSGNSYIDQPGNGTFNYSVTAVDFAANESAHSNTANAVVASYPAPSFTVGAGEGKSINITFSNVQPGTTEYDVYINGKLYAISAPTASTYNILVSDYGTYNIYVVAKFGSVSSSNSATQTLTLSAPVAPVSTPVVVQSSVKSSLTTPTSAQAAIIAPVTIPGVDDQGQIKAAEDTSSTSSNKINWTPWIILFILILLAGAATGGYFYWFGGDSEASAATVATGEKTTAAAPLKKDAPKATSAKGGKKPRRW